MDLKIDTTYVVNHSRKGTFTLKITNIDDTWITGTIVEGKTRAIMSYNEKEIGEKITIRKSFCNFTKC